MPQPCRVCHHPAVKQINKALLRGDPYRRIMVRYEVGKDSLARHLHRHLKAAVLGTITVKEVRGGHSIEYRAKPPMQVLEELWAKREGTATKSRANKKGGIAAASPSNKAQASGTATKTGAEMLTKANSSTRAKSPATGRKPPGTATKKRTEVLTKVDIFVTPEAFNSHQLMPPDEAPPLLTKANIFDEKTAEKLWNETVVTYWQQSFVFVGLLSMVAAQCPELTEAEVRAALEYATAQGLLRKCGEDFYVISSPEAKERLFATG